MAELGAARSQSWRSLEPERAQLGARAGFAQSPTVLRPLRQELAPGTLSACLLQGLTAAVFLHVQACRTLPAIRNIAVFAFIAPHPPSSLLEAFN